MRTAWPLHVLACGLLGATALAQPLVVAASERMREPLEKLLERRSRQGLTPEFVALDELDAVTPDQRREALAEILCAKMRASEQPGYVLLVAPVEGEAAVSASVQPGMATFLDAPFAREAIPTDQPLVDDGDGRPEWSIGRWNTADPEVVARMVAKSARYEREPEGPWLDRMVFIGGEGNFGAVMDTAIETAVQSFFAAEYAPEKRIRFLMGIEGNPFFYNPLGFSKKAVSLLDGGPAFFVYAGHGLKDRFANMVVTGERDGITVRMRVPVFTKREARALSAEGYRTIFTTFACHIGTFEHGGLGHTLAREPEGPVAVLAASEVSGPFGDLLFGSAMAAVMREPGSLRLGDLVRKAKKRLMDGSRSRTESLARTVAGAFGLSRDAQHKFRRYTSELYQIIGDPSLPLRRPSGTAVIDIERSVRDEPIVCTIDVEGVSAPIDLTVELRLDRGVIPERPAVAVADGEDRAALDRTWDAAHDNAIHRVDVRWKGEPLRVQIDPGRTLKPTYYVLRAHGAPAGKYVSGGVRFRVRY